MKTKLTSNQGGFTLIELIMVIVILGILAVVAIPKYADLQTEAAEAAADGVYGAAQAAAAINFSARLVGQAGPAGAMITNNTTLVAALDGGLPEGWSYNAVDGDSIQITVNSVTYAVTVSSAETTTSKAVIGKSGW